MTATWQRIRDLLDNFPAVECGNLVNAGYASA